MSIPPFPLSPPVVSLDQRLDFGQVASLDRLHEDVPLGGRELHEVPYLANADLVVLDFDAGARVARRAERDILLHHHRFTSFPRGSGRHAEHGAARLARAVESDATPSSAAPMYVRGFDSKTNFPTTTITDAATPNARGVRVSARYASTAIATTRKPTVSGS